MCDADNISDVLFLVSDMYIIAMVTKKTSVSSAYYYY